jgi:hypothetical protein
MPVACDPLVRLWYYVTPNDTECWEWRGHKNHSGYGLIRVGRKMRSVHRFAYEAMVGPLDPTLDIMHTCDTRACVNPAHLRLASTAENIRDMIAKGRDNFRGKAQARDRAGVCGSGRHKWIPENWAPSSDGRRRCLPCIKERSAKKWRSPVLDG